MTTICCMDLHHSMSTWPLTCVFGRFSVHRPRWGSPLPSVLWLSRVPLIRGLSLNRIRTCSTHWTRGVAGITYIRLHHVPLRGVTLRRHLARVTGSSWAAALVWRGLIEIHVWVESSPKEEKESRRKKHRQNSQADAASSKCHLHPSTKCFTAGN